MNGYNVQPIATDNLTGIGNYAAEMLMRLLKDEENYELHVFNFLGRNNSTDNISKHLKGNLNEKNIHTVKGIPLSIYIRMGKLGRIIPYKTLTSSDCDVNVFFNYLAPAGLKGKSIITIYDMVCERFPETMDDRNRKLLQRHLKSSAENASAIITISEFSKNEIIDILKIPEERIFVAPCGVDTSFYCKATADETQNELKYLKEKWDLDKYILYVGTLEPRKNTGVIVKAFDILAKDDKDLKLVLAGGLGWHPEQTLSAIENSPYKDRIIRTGYISNEDKRSLLRNCSVFCFPSLYEGFGMPVTEAMACGAPAVISNTSSLPEASKGLVPALNPDDFEGFARKMKTIIDNGISEDTKEKYIEAASSFCWDQSSSIIRKAIEYARDVK